MRLCVGERIEQGPQVQYGYSATPIKSLQDVLPVQLHLPGYETRLTQGPAAALEGIYLPLQPFVLQN